MRIKTRTFFLISLMFVLADNPLKAQNLANANDEVQHLTAQLQSSPDDNTLRKKIISLVLTLNPRPHTTDEVTMAEGAAEYAFKNAQSNSDFSDAAKQYEKALLLAPWLATDYFNCGLAHEKAGEYKGAIRSYTFYLLAAPTANDAQAVKKLIGGLQYAGQKVEEQNNASAKEAAQKAAVYQGLDGGVWIYDKGYASINGGQEYKAHDRSNLGDDENGYIEIHGHEITKYMIWDNPNSSIYKLNPHLQNTREDMVKTIFESRQFNVDPKLFEPRYRNFTSYRVKISEDGQAITIEDSGNGWIGRGIYQRIK